MITLYDYWRSGAAHRVRIGLALKGVAYATSPVDLRVGAQRDPAHRARNPQGFVPALDTGHGDGVHPGGVLTQSLAILEWLEETHPAPPLLPQDAAARAQVRAMAGIVACDVHPLGNLRVLNALREQFGADDAAIKTWMTAWIDQGLAAVETLSAAGPPGAWCWGDAPGLADCAVVPQLYAAVTRYGHDLARHPRLAAVYAASQAHPAFQAAHPDRWNS